MAISPLNSSFYADPASLNGLKQEAKAQTPEALRETARQFESLFTSMMLKSMREASSKDELMGSDQQDFYQDMFDQQMSMQLSKGRGLGLADVLVKQLMQSGLAGASGDAAAAGAAVDAPAQTGFKLPGTAQQWPPRSREDFVKAILPAAREAADKLGVDPATIVAHAALETGWGQRVPVGADGKPSFNLFGIKSGASWQGADVTAATHEYENGGMRPTLASFRAYASPQDSVSDYASFLGGNPRYAGALGAGSDAMAFGKALQKAGYATDPDYANKLDAVARGLKSQFSLPITGSEV